MLKLKKITGKKKLNEVFTLKKIVYEEHDVYVITIENKTPEGKDRPYVKNPFNDFRLASDIFKKYKAKYTGDEKKFNIKVDPNNANKSYSGDKPNLDFVWYWTTAEYTKEQIQEFASKAIKEANDLVYGKKTIPSKYQTEFDPLTDINNVKTLANLKRIVEIGKEIYQKLVTEQKGVRVAKMVNDYFNDLLSDLTESSLNQEIEEFTEILEIFGHTVGDYYYSPTNALLVRIQCAGQNINTLTLKDGLGPKSYWVGRGYTPIDDEKGFIILAPKGGGWYADFFNKTKKYNPKLIAQFLKTIRKPTDAIDQITPRQFWVWAFKNGYVPHLSTRSFKGVMIYTMEQVKPIEGAERVDMTRSANYFGDEGNLDDDDKIIALFGAINSLCVKLGIDVGFTGGSDPDFGYSEDSGVNKSKIAMSINSGGLTKLNTMLHELAHQIFHQRKGGEFLDGKYSIKISKDDTQEYNVKEIQAEAFAYIVLSIFGYKSELRKNLRYIKFYDIGIRTRDELQKILNFSTYVVQYIKKHFANKSRNRSKKPSDNDNLNEMIYIIKNQKENLKKIIK